jgi:hypothetical protein
MANLSISVAWDETKAILAREGKLLASVALALIALPALVNGLVTPVAAEPADRPLWSHFLVVVASLIALAGQLALIRLALGPSIAVGSAIAHGQRRVPVYLVAGIVILVVLIAAAIPFMLVLVAMGVPIEPHMKPAGLVAILLLIYMAVVLFVGIRMLMAGPVASAEAVGPIAILKRSWALTDGHFWRLLGFVAIFFVAALVVLLAVGAAVGVVAGLAAGPIKPMSASALVVALVQALLNAAVTTVFAVMLARLYVQSTGGSEAQASVPKSGT